MIVIELIFCSDEKFAKPAGPDSKGGEKYGVGDMKLLANCTEKREYFFSLKTPGWLKRNSKILKYNSETGE